MDAIPYDDIPLVKGLPLVGNLPKFLRDPLANARSLEVHGNVVRSRTFFETVTLLGPEANQFVLHDREGNFSSRGGWYYWIDAVFPGAIMAMDDPAHKHHRRIMQGAFKRSAMERYVADMGPVIADVLARWQPGTMKVFPQIKALTLNIAARVFMGMALGPRGRPHEPGLHRHGGSLAGADPQAACRPSACGAACARAASWWS